MIALLLLLGSGPPQLDGVGLDSRPRALLPLEMALADEEGRTRPLGAWLGGEPTLLVLAYYRCPSLCDVVVREAAAAAASLASPPHALVVSFDPGDTPEAARAARGDLGWPFLRAGDGADRLLDAVGMRVRRDVATGRIAHPAAVFVVSPTGRLAAVIEGPRPDPARLARALDAAREEGFEGGAIGWVLSCFRWEPAHRVAGPVAERFLRVGSALIFGAFALFLGAMAARGRR